MERQSRAQQNTVADPGVNNTGANNTGADVMSEVDSDVNADVMSEVDSDVNPGVVSEVDSDVDPGMLQSADPGVNNTGAGVMSEVDSDVDPGMLQSADPVVVPNVAPVPMLVASAPSGATVELEPVSKLFGASLVTINEFKLLALDYKSSGQNVSMRIKQDTVDSFKYSERKGHRLSTIEHALSMALELRPMCDMKAEVSDSLISFMQCENYRGLENAQWDKKVNEYIEKNIKRNELIEFLLNFA